MAALNRVEAGLPVQEMCGALSISTDSFYKWRAKFGGRDTSMITHMKELADENRHLRKMYLEEKLKAEIANEYLAKK
jgi:putative transposase